MVPALAIVLLLLLSAENFATPFGFYLYFQRFMEPPIAHALLSRLAFSNRHGLLQVDKMLDEELLVGPGRQARDTLRPLAYSTLADLVHHVKDQIDLNQVSRVIQVRFAGDAHGMVDEFIW